MPATYILDIEGQRPVTGFLEFEVAPEPSVQLYMHREDSEVDNFDYQIRPCAPCPAVFPLDTYGNGHYVFLNRQWQYFLIAINPGMELRHVAGILNHQLAFANGTGFGDPDGAKANYILNVDLDKPLPALDKVRTTSRSVLTGTEYQDQVGNWWVHLDLLDGTQDPPLKPGRVYPQRVEDINPDDYLYIPRTHPQYFCAGKNIKTDGNFFAWDDGAFYDWCPDGFRRTFLYHVSNLPIRYPLRKLKKLPPGDPIPNPFVR